MFTLVLMALAAIAWKLFGESVNDILVLVMVFASIIGTVAVFSYWKNKTDRLKIRKTFELERKGVLTSKRGKVIIRIAAYCLQAICIFLISKQQMGIGFSFALILTVIVIPVFFLSQNILAVDYNGIRYPFKWDVRWQKVKSYRIDKENGILSVEKTDGSLKQAARIKNEDLAEVQEMIEKYITQLS